MKIFYIILAFLAGAMFSFLTLQFHFFEFSYSITVSDLVQIIVGIAVAIVLPSYLGKKVESNKKQVDFIIDELTNVLSVSEEISRELERMSNDGTKPPKKIISLLFEKLLKYAGAIETYVKELDLPSDKIGNIMEAVIELKAKITGGELFNDDFIMEQLMLSKFMSDYYDFKTNINTMKIKVMKL